jgi:hypothetical protein
MRARFFRDTGSPSGKYERQRRDGGDIILFIPEPAGVGALLRRRAGMQRKMRTQGAEDTAGSFVGRARQSGQRDLEQASSIVEIQSITGQRPETCHRIGEARRKQVGTAEDFEQPQAEPCPLRAIPGLEVSAEFGLSHDGCHDVLGQAKQGFRSAEDAPERVGVDEIVGFFQGAHLLAESGM